MYSLSKIIHGKHFKMGASVFAIYLLLCGLVMLRMPYATSSFSINGLLAVLLSFVIIAWCGIKKCSSHLVMAIVFLINIGVCAQCVISKTAAHKQAALFVAASLCGGAAVLFWDRLEEYIKTVPPLKLLGFTAGASGLLYFILLVMGRNVNGARAWLYIGKFSIQLTEPAKLLAVVFFALLFSRRDIPELQKIIYGSAFYVFNAVFLAAVNELGTLLVISFVFAAMCFLFIRSAKYVAITLGSFAFILLAGYIIIRTLSGSAESAIQAGGKPGGLSALAYKIYSKIGQRFEIWLHRDRMDSNGVAYQSLKARDAIIVGGAFGSPLNVYIPYSGSDFIFPSLILRFGLVMGIAVFLLFFTIYYYGTAVCLMIPHSLSRTMCSGCVLCIVIQALLMIFGSTNFFIMTGIPIPFLSAGGTAQIVTFIMSGLAIHFSEGMEGAVDRG